MLEAVRTLVLWRHAKSAWDDPALPDLLRPLAPRGEIAAPRMARWIGARWAPEAVLCSPARRTVTTLACLPLPPTSAVCYDLRLHEAEWPALLQAIRRFGGDAPIMLLVGHNPGLECLVAALAAPVPAKFTTAACAVLQFNGDWSRLGPGVSRLIAFQRPKELPAG
jgi:phosphohistidine phosphatase